VDNAEHGINLMSVCPTSQSYHDYGGQPIDIDASQEISGVFVN
jgi:hypothetical protein